MMLYTNQIRMLLYKTECWSAEDFIPEEPDQQDVKKLGPDLQEMLL